MITQNWTVSLVRYSGRMNLITWAQKDPSINCLYVQIIIVECKEANGPFLPIPDDFIRKMLTWHFIHFDFILFAFQTLCIIYFCLYAHFFLSEFYLVVGVLIYSLLSLLDNSQLIIQFKQNFKDSKSGFTGESDAKVSEKMGIDVYKSIFVVCCLGFVYLGLGFKKIGYHQDESSCTNILKTHTTFSYWNYFFVIIKFK